MDKLKKKKKKLNMFLSPCCQQEQIPTCSTGFEFNLPIAYQQKCHISAPKLLTTYCQLENGCYLHQYIKIFYWLQQATKCFVCLCLNNLFSAKFWHIALEFGEKFMQNFPSLFLGKTLLLTFSRNSPVTEGKLPDQETLVKK